MRDGENALTLIWMEPNALTLEPNALTLEPNALTLEPYALTLIWNLNSELCTDPDRELELGTMH
jgi:hypothetical protein